MFGQSALLLFAATLTVAGGREVTMVSHGQMAVGQKFEIQTADRVFRGQLLDRASGECRIATSVDGKTFSAPRTIYLLGATSGRQAGQMLVLMHDVRVGLRLELGLDDLDPKNRHVTSEVRAIRLME